MNSMKIMIMTGIALVLALGMVSAVAVNSVDSPNLAPGEEGTIRIELKNILSSDVQDVSVSIDLSKVSFIPVGSSEDSVDEISEGDKETFSFRIRASNSILAGDYEIPYTIKYTNSDTEKQDTKQGTIGVRVVAQPSLEFSSSTDNPIVGQKGKATLKIVNKGLYEAKFVSVKLVPSGFTLLSEPEVYIGTIDSDDFDTASFDVIFNSINADMTAIVTYKDFDNNNVIKNVDLPLNVYTRERALELGLITQSYTFVYVLVVAVLVILWFIYRSIRKRRRMKRSLASAEQR